jgi:hypothetical protein
MKRREFEACEFEARRDAAANQRPCSQAHRLLPAMRRNGELWTLSREEIGAEAMHACLAAVWRNPDFQGRPGVEMPDLGGIDLVPARNLAGAEKKINQRRDGPAPRIPRRIAKGLTEKAALRMRLQIEQADDFGGASARDGINRHFVYFGRICHRGVRGCDQCRKKSNQYQTARPQGEKGRKISDCEEDSVARPRPHARGRDPPQ